MLVLDSSAVTSLSERTQTAAALLTAFREKGLLPAVVPAVVLVECLTGDGRRDALPNRFLKTCDIAEEIPEQLARRAARLRTLAKQGSAVDALLVAVSEPGGTVLTSDVGDLRALAQRADKVRVERI